MKTFIRCIFLLGMIYPLAAFSQTEQEKKKKEEEPMKGIHRLSLAMAHTHVSQGIVNGSKKWLVMASFCLDYDYWLHNKWAIGLHTDVTIEEFSVEQYLRFEEGEDSVIKRNYPVSLIAVGMFKPTRHSTFTLGAGAEIAGSGVLAVTRIEYEWSTALPQNWELGINIMYDVHWNSYDSWSMAFGVSKLFPPRKKTKTPER